MTIYNPKPLPLLAPKVDLRNVSTISGNVINRGLYRSIFHALGCRYRSDSFFGLSNFKIATSQSGKGVASRSSSFTFRQTSSTYSGFPTTDTTSIQWGSSYVVCGAPDWNLNRTYANRVSITVNLNGTAYSFDASSFENYFAGFEYRNYATTITTNNNLLLAPYEVVWRELILTNNWIASDYDVLPIFSDAYDPSKVRCARPIIFAPTRPLLATPALIADERVDQLVSLNGRSYRASYSRRRIYEVKMLLDGSTKGNDAIFDPLALWRRFLIFADAGVTLWIDRNWLCNFWRPRTSFVCADMPNEISGALLDASITRFEPRDGIQDAYEVTLQIADETECEGFIFGSMPSL